MKIYLGADHAGFNLKEKIKGYLRGAGYMIEDQGAFILDPADDYPDFVTPVAKQVSAEPNEVLGIIVGGTGQGEAMAANRLPQVRATVYYGGQEEIVKLSREHNNANILSLGARFLGEEEALEAVKMWLATAYTNDERHERRLKKIDDGGAVKPF
ncbi:MAG: RpiB/LacA/LacB family sugar-phosphate isomerase [Candidatus Pacebacteria bacterium]|nr:RpiB/LacA/LacB family sugar-phosphate isomerase [Candidatus Paceibacterota bacterium]